MSIKEEISWSDFEKIDIRVGTILKAEKFASAKKPAYFIHVDFGSELGVKKSSAQITECYKPADLIGKQVLAVVNFPPKQIANKISECLLLGIYGEKGVVLITPDKKVNNGFLVG